MAPIIEAENISKKYDIGYRESYVALRDVLVGIFKSPLRWLADKTGNNRAAREFWALKNVSFKVEKGEVLGVIGRNGAGKSTLLKILSQITPPTSGQITIRGSLGSLLEVGTGFHPELTGRENIFLNGAILGMRKAEIERKFDQIVEFSGIGNFLDTPVKRYSSGMYVRLAFSVAAHLEPDILLIDEVLAVGDAEFQKKCLRKMEEVTQKDGRTIIFISHNISAVEQLCHKCLLLDKGEVIKYGPTEEVVSFYLSQTASGQQSHIYAKRAEDQLFPEFVELQAASLSDAQGNAMGQFGTADDIYVNVEYEVKQPVDNLVVANILINEENQAVFETRDRDTDTSVSGQKLPGHYAAKCKIPKKLLKPGKYYVAIGGFNPGQQHFFSAREALSFDVRATEGPGAEGKNRMGVVVPELEWTTNKH